MDTALQTRVAPTTATPAPWGRVRRSRYVADRALKIVCTLFTILGATVLGWILLMLLVEGIGGLSTGGCSPRRRRGPARRAAASPMRIVGSLILTFLGIVVATPVGVLAGTYLAEYGKGSKLAEVIRFLNDILLAAPSILIGLFVYTLMVQPMGRYSGWAGGVALAIIAVPVIVRTTEDMLRLVPGSLREAGAALGAPMSTVIMQVELAGGPGRHGDGRAAGDRPHRRRDRAAALHRSQQQFLVQART